MKYIKTYETISTDLHKYDLLLMKSYYSPYDHELCILLNDVPRSKRILDVLHIAEISFSRNTVGYEIVNVDEEKHYKKEDTRILNKEEKKILFTNIFLTQPYNGLVDRIKKELNYDITTSEDYQNFLITQSANKYNL